MKNKKLAELRLELYEQPLDPDSDEFGNLYTLIEGKDDHLAGMILTFMASSPAFANIILTAARNHKTTKQ